MILFDHLRNGIDIILQISINCNRHVRIVNGRCQSRQKRILMSIVATESDSGHIFKLFFKLLDQFPRLVFAAIIDKQQLVLQKS